MTAKYEKREKYLSYYTKLFCDNEIIDSTETNLRGLSSIVLSLCSYFMLKSTLSESKNTFYLPYHVCQTQEQNILNKRFSIFNSK